MSPVGRRERRLAQWDETAAALRAGLGYQVSGGILAAGVAGGGTALSLALASGGIAERSPAALRTVTALALIVIAAAVLLIVLHRLRANAGEQTARLTRASWPVPADYARGDLDETADLPSDVRLPEDALSPADLAALLAPTPGERADARRRSAAAGLDSRSIAFAATTLAGFVAAFAGLVLALGALVVLGGAGEGIAVTGAALLAAGAAMGVATGEASPVPHAVSRVAEARLARGVRLLLELWPGDTEQGVLAVRDGVVLVDRRAMAGIQRTPARERPPGRGGAIALLVAALLAVSLLPLLS